MNFPDTKESLIVLCVTPAVPAFCPKCTDCLQLRSLLFMLLAMLSTSSSAYGKVIPPGLKPESPFKQAGCLTQKDPKFPQTVRVNISISNTNQDSRATPDVSSRSLAPWDYRYDLYPYDLEMVWLQWSRIMPRLCPHLHFQYFTVESFWKCEGIHSSYNSPWKLTNMERNAEQKHALCQHTEGKANCFCNFTNLFLYWGKF